MVLIFLAGSGSSLGGPVGGLGQMEHRPVLHVEDGRILGPVRELQHEPRPFGRRQQEIPVALARKILGPGLHALDD